MKKTITTIIGCLFGALAIGQPAAWTWAKSGLGSISDHGEAVATDLNGNVYSTGFFESPSIVFGTYTLVNSSLPNPAGPVIDAFLVKYDAAGNVLWAISAGGDYIEESYAVDTDASGNIYIGGASSSTLLTIGTMTVTKSPSEDIFVAKLDANGNVLWIRTGITDSQSRALGVSTDPGGNVVVAGFAHGASLVIGSHTLTNQAGSIVYVAKYDANGNVLWAQQSNSYDSYFGFAQSVDIDPTQGDIYVAGYYGNLTLVFGNYSLTNARVTTPPTTVYGNGNDAFILKYLANGTLVWAKTLGGSEDEQGVSVSVSPSRDPNYYEADVYVGGNFGSAVLVADSKTLSNSSSSLGQKDMFVLKLDPETGNTVWASGMGGGSIDLLNEVAAVKHAGVLLYGTFSSSVISSGTVMAAKTNSAGGLSTDIVVAGFNAAGQAFMAKTAGGTASEEGFGMTIDKTSLDVYVNGFYSSAPTNFDNIQLTANNRDVFTAQLSVPEFERLVSVGIPAHSISDWIIAPNPVSDALIIKTAESAGAVTVVIYNVLGQAVISSVFGSSESISINLSSVPGGIYTVAVAANEETLTKKIIKK